MSTLNVMVCVADRSQLHRFQTIFQDNGVELNLISMGRGTASNEILDVLGIGNTEKAVCVSVVTDTLWKRLRRDFRVRLHIDMPGVGIAFLLPLSSVGGKNVLELLTMEQDYRKEEESTLKDTAYELIVAICEQGYSETVMDAARKGGAGGGTILHAKGTGQKKAEQFLGITLAAEKNLLLIVARKEDKNEIMRNIMQDAGLKTRAKALCISLPVTDVTGIRAEEAEECE